MADKYRRFAELKPNQVYGRDYAIVAIPRYSPLAVIAPHGGTIEPTTSELARAVAGDEYSLYCFEGLVRERPHEDLHITSEFFDEPHGRALVAASDFAVAIHGRKDGDDSETVWLGGLDDQLISVAATELGKARFKAKSVTGALGGKGVANICNAGRTGAGLQLELPRALRDHLRDNPDRLNAFADALRAAISQRLAGTETI
jgi:phage replication-related protein YjqB (UPF0714/DUF867 family)